MRIFQRKTSFIISIILLLFALCLSGMHLYLARKNQVDRIQLAEINSIRYGLLNADEWRKNLTNVISTKIEDFELTDENRQQLQDQVETLMYKLLDQVEQIIKNDMGKIKKFLVNAFVDLDKLREKVPQLSAQLLTELSKPENKNNLKNIVKERLDDVVSETFNKDEQNKLQEILQNENFENKEQASQEMQHSIEKTKKRIRTYSILLVIMLVPVFVLNYFSSNRFSKNGLLILLSVTFLFLVNGIAVPMIDIEAKITKITFVLLGEDITFRDQVLFFQSKSILDVVWILITNGKWDMLVVGVLILSFSVFFPVMKIIGSFFSIRSPKYSKNKLVRFFTFKSSKWSMADVFVVAIFMAFIGINGIIADQLSHLRNVNKYVEVLTTNGTNLQSGFYFFVLFCLSGIFLSLSIQNKLEKS